MIEASVLFIEKCFYLFLLHKNNNKVTATRLKDCKHLLAWRNFAFFGNFWVCTIYTFILYIYI